jgi:hypothetical protein
MPAKPVPEPTAVSCIAEVDLDSLDLPESKESRAWQLHALATEYAAQTPRTIGLERFVVLVITSRSRRSGLWIWLGATEPGLVNFSLTP